jgi:hypothetical protein
MELVSTEGSVKEYTWPKRTGIYSEQVRTPCTRTCAARGPDAMNQYLDIYDTILKTDVPKTSHVLGPRAEFHELPPEGHKPSETQFFWPDVKYMEWTPQRWMFDATYLSTHPDLPCAPFDEPTPVKDVKISAWYADAAEIQRVTPAKRLRESSSAQHSAGSYSQENRQPLSTLMPPPQLQSPTPASSSQQRPRRAYDLMSRLHQGDN